MAGINDNARYPTYGAACCAVKLPAATPTTLNARSRIVYINAMPIAPTTAAQKIPSPIFFDSSLASPPAAALATTGATTLGMNDMIQNAL